MRLSPGSRPSPPRYHSPQLEMGAGLGLTPGTNFSSFPIPQIHDLRPAAGSDYCLESSLFHHQSASRATTKCWNFSNYCFSVTGWMEKTGGMETWKSWAQLITVAIECTVIRLHHSVLLPVGSWLRPGKTHTHTLVTDCKFCFHCFFQLSCLSVRGPVYVLEHLCSVQTLFLYELTRFVGFYVQ